ncbi:hypothetical protein [Sulfuriroseicoccus oceanibius]|uniref:Uncharacterized protein n=1 Tax=Sulfuriroseicoccus oceanibius TaxID=2707525 RepID=A0A6B3LAX0_9BACT|nr:hypothetical protein [Sulfuriroseicoccus oceanibius]QQL44680.1 hypothetical protein G3M56_012450 [Sulfuriroseicoccus oceanibius]
MSGPSGAVPVGDAVLNWAGRNSEWVGRNRSGGVVSYEKDELGEFPLGDTRVPGRNAIDRYARLHDIEYWVCCHVPAGVQVEIPAPQDRLEYLVSNGAGGLTGANLRVVGKVLVAPTRLVPWSCALGRGRASPDPSVPVEYFLLFDAERGSTVLVPANDRGAAETRKKPRLR